MEEEKKETETTEETPSQPSEEKDTQATEETTSQPSSESSEPTDNGGQEQIEQAVADVANNKDLLEVNKKLDTILNLLSENHASTADEKEIVEDENDDETSKAEAEAFEQLID